MQYSPWGKIQLIAKYERGFVRVHTASHGGYRISKGFADKKLSKAAIERAEIWGNYFWYEEDCAAAIVEYELNTGAEEESGKLFKELSRYYPEYLLDRGINPDPVQYNRWIKSYTRGRKISEKDPGEVISAVGINETTVKVLTADEKEYYVSKESYRQCRKNEDFQLSNMELVNL